jgi:GNAT superfamily N-acetyltransferase
MSASEAAREEAEQRMVDQRGQERRDMYRIPGNERVFSDPEGRHIALRVEDNTGAKAQNAHPPIAFIAFWGARQVGFANGELVESKLRIYQYDTTGGYDKRGIAQEILKEAEAYAKTKGLKLVCAPAPQNGIIEWDETFFAQCGYTRDGEEFHKSV